MTIFKAMDTVEAGIISNIQTYIDNENTEIGETLVYDFLEEAFYSWEDLNTLPNYDICYLLQPALDNPDTDSIDDGGTALSYEIDFIVIIRENGQCNLKKTAHAYLPMLIKLFNDKIVRKVSPDCRIVADDTLPVTVRDEQGNPMYRVQLAAVTIGFTVPI